MPIAAVLPALAIGGATVAGSLISSSAAKNAASQETTAANRSADIQQNIFNQTQQNLSPYRGGGSAGLNALLEGLGLSGPSSTPSGSAAGSASVGGMNIPIGGDEPTNPTPGTRWIDMASGSPVLKVWDGSEGRWGIPNDQQQASFLGGNSLASILSGVRPGAQTGNPTSFLDSPLLKPFSMDEATLEQTPGYKFNLAQGLKAVQNAAAARGLGTSGAALKGAASYATGLADNTFQTQANNYYTGQGNAFSRLMGLAGLGENAAAGQGQIGAQTGANIGNSLIGAGQAQAAGTVGSANAISGGLGSLSNLYLTNKLLGGGLFGSGSGGGVGMYGNLPTAVGVDPSDPVMSLL